VKLDESCSRSPSVLEQEARSHDDGCHAPGRVRWRARTPSTRTWPLPSTSPRKRPAGSRGVASTRTSRSCGTRQAPGARATRPSVRPVAAGAMCARLTRAKTDAVSASTAAAVATRTTRSRAAPLPSDLPDASRGRRRGASTQRRWMPCAVRATAAPRARSSAHPGWGRSSIVRIRAHVNRRPAALCFRGVTRAGVTPQKPMR
jgi:hypothetical protein